MDLQLRKVFREGLVWGLLGLWLLLFFACNPTTSSPASPTLLVSQADISKLREHAQTSEGKGMLQRLRQVLAREADPFELSSNAVGYATLYLLEENTRYLDSARFCVLGMLGDSIEFQGIRDTLGLWNSDYKAIYRAELLMDIALAYDMCREAWPDSVSAQVAQALYEKARVLMDAPGQGYNDSPWSNWQGIVNGGIGMAWLALWDHEKYGAAAQTRMETVLARFTDHFSYFGDYMWTAEGFNYLRYELCASTAPFILAYRNRIDPEFLKGTSLDRVIPFFVSQSLIVDQEIYTPIYGQLQSRMEMSRWRSGIWNLMMGLSKEKDRRVARWLYDQTYGQAGKQNFNIFQAKDALYALLYYPFEEEALSPEGVYPLALYDQKQGYCLFRSGWEEDAVIATLIDNHQARRASHSHRDAGSMRLLGLGEDWIYKGEKALHESKRHGPYLESMVLVEGADHWRGGKILAYESQLDGSGRVQMDLTPAYFASPGFKDFKSVGVEKAIRDVEVEFGGENAATLRVRDTLIGGKEKVWQIASPQPYCELSPQGFTLLNQTRDKSLQVRFIGESQPMRITREADRIKAYFGSQDLFSEVEITLSQLP